MRRRVLRALAAAAFYLALWGALALLLRSQGRSLLLPGPAESFARLAELMGSAAF